MASSNFRLLVSAPCGSAWLAWLSQPPSSSTAACGPSLAARNSPARRASASACPRGPPAPPIIGAASAIALSLRSARARASACASTGSARYKRSTRATRSIDGSGSTDGAQVSMSPGPRSTSGTAVCSAMPLRPLAASARPSQPVPSSCGLAPPDSSSCCASKCDRSRYGRPVACTTTRSPRPYSACISDSAGCSANGPSSGSGAAASCANGPRAALKDSSRGSGTAVRPSRPPRSTISASRASWPRAWPARLNWLHGASAALLNKAPMNSLRAAIAFSLNGAGIPAPSAAASAPAGPSVARSIWRAVSSLSVAPNALAARARASTWRPARSPTRVAHSRRFQTASGPSHSSARSGQPAGEGARCTGCPSSADAAHRARV